MAELKNIEFELKGFKELKKLSEKLQDLTTDIEKTTGEIRNLKLSIDIVKGNEDLTIK